MNDPQRVCEFIAANFLAASKWPPSDLLSWVLWHWERGLISFVECNGRILGVGMARILTRKEDFADPLYHDPEGSIFWVDMLIAPSIIEKYPLALEGLKACPNCHTIGFERGAREGSAKRPRFYSRDEFTTRLMERNTYGIS